jgi:glucose/arabinose dehydrogenase
MSETMTRSAVLAFLLALPAYASDPVLVFEPVASGLQSPVSITHAGDARLFITLQAGQVVIHDGTRLLPTPFLDIRSLVLSGGERGLLSVAFHPRYAENGFFFVNYTDRNGDTIVARYRVSADPNVADLSSSRQILFVDQPYANHNGGQLQFGPDGYLYVGMGDGGSAGDPENRAQNRNTLLGKMLRLDVDADPYAIPPSNPYASSGTGRPEIWAYGLRNPWRFSFDRATGELWIADVGQGSWEEVNLQPASSIGGENYGWDVMEGTHCFGAATCTRTGLVEPVIEYNHSGGACSVTGGYVYRGARSPRLQGRYLYGDYCNGKIWSATRTVAGAWESRQLADTTFLISTFGEDFNGEVYVADHAGSVYRIVDSLPMPQKRRTARQ